MTKESLIEILSILDNCRHENKFFPVSTRKYYMEDGSTVTEDFLEDCFLDNLYCEITSQFPELMEEIDEESKKIKELLEPKEKSND